MFKKKNKKTIEKIEVNVESVGTDWMPKYVELLLEADLVKARAIAKVNKDMDKAVDMGERALTNIHWAKNSESVDFVLSQCLEGRRGEDVAMFFGVLACAFADDGFLHVTDEYFTKKKEAK